MEYAYIHIHPWAKSKQSNKNTVDWPANKGSQIKTKLTKAQTVKQK